MSPAGKLGAGLFEFIDPGANGESRGLEDVDDGIDFSLRDVGAGEGDGVGHGVGSVVVRERVFELPAVSCDAQVLAKEAPSPRPASCSLSPVLRGEGWGEGCGDELRNS